MKITKTIFIFKGLKLIIEINMNKILLYNMLFVIALSFKLSVVKAYRIDNVIDSILSEHTINDFVTNLQNQPITPLPFSFAEYLFDSLENKEGQYMDELRENYFYYKQSIDLFSNTKIQSLFQIDTTSIFTNGNLQEDYYYLYFDCKCSISTPYFLNRLPKLDTITEVFLTLSIIRTETHDRGVVITLYFFDTISNKVIEKKNILTAGLGGEDIPYYEGFVIQEDYSINTYSYTNDEVIGIETRIKFLKNCKHYLNRIESITKHTYSEYDEDCDE